MGIEIRQAKKQDLNKMLNIIESYPFAKKWDKPLAEKYYKTKFNKKCNCFKEDKIFVGTVDNKFLVRMNS